MQRIGPNQYVHVLDVNTNIVSIICGPLTVVCKENEKVIFGPEKMITIAPMEYCVIENPIIHGADGNVTYNELGEAVLDYGEVEYRFKGKPFPLYPGEKIIEGPSNLIVLNSNTELLLKAKISFTDSNGINRLAGQKWCFKGPAVYYPRKEVTVEKTVEALMVQPGKALELTVDTDTVDCDGNSRVFGETWIMQKPGAYLLGPYERLVKVVDSVSLTEKLAIHVEALISHIDSKKVRRAVGDQWLVNYKDCDYYLPNVFEKIVNNVEVTTLTRSHYCVIINPMTENGTYEWGKKRLVVGEKSFFLHPYESLANGIEDIYVLTEDEGLILSATEAFVDETNVSKEAGGKLRQPGERWLLRGPVEYVPPVQVKVVCKRTAVPLDQNEGIYVRNTKTGSIRSVIGTSYMLTEEEALWEKPLPESVRNILATERDPLAERGVGEQRSPTSFDQTYVINTRIPHNAAVQIYDYAEKKARVVFGPDRVLLGPDEHFTELRLSGGKPKRANLIYSLCLLLGPDFCTDQIIVETSDHARLSLQVSYNWSFLVDRNSSQEEATKIFSVPDFVGDMCKAFASRIRGMVAAVSFDEFHTQSTRIIRSSVFGLDENGKIRKRIVFPQNLLCVSNIDVKSVEPVDQRTRDSLMKSVQMAIEITTNSQEATAKHEADKREQVARGRLERQRIEDEVNAEASRKDLIELQVKSAALESTGQAAAEASSRAEASLIEAQAAVDIAKLKTQAQQIDAEAELTRLKLARRSELDYMKRKDELELKHKELVMAIETSKFSEMVTTIGKDTLRSLAQSGPDQDLRMLKALGLQSTLITDGTSPINLLSTAHGLIGKSMGVVEE